MKLVITDIEDLSLSLGSEYKIIKPKEQMKNCIGCFGCWIKTPGQCVIRDSYGNMGKELGHSDELILISECCYGSVSPFVKMVLDRSISYIHPDFVKRKGEMHHKRRYSNVLSITAFFYGKDINDKEKETAKALIQGNADNFDAKVREVEFLNSIEELEGIRL